MNDSQVSNNNFYEKYKLFILIALYLVASVAAAIICVKPLRYGIIPVLVFIVLEALLCFFLDNTPVWLHGAVIIVQLVFGYITKNIYFTLVMAAIYIVALVVMYFYHRAPGMLPVKALFGKKEAAEPAVEESEEADDK
ncbi:MAG: hypothetical protein K6A69_04345 [Lachnospiraceae bacterium]|nr:hypothetical protein [Lachnospiraceae bacterium]